MPFLNSAERVYAYAALTYPFVEFNYSDFSSTTDLSLVSVFGVVGNALYLTDTAGGDVGNAYRSTAIRYDRNFEFTWNFECSGGSSPPADGFCLQWTPTNNTNGDTGGGCGRVATAIHALLFQTYTNNAFVWYTNNVIQTTQGGQDFYRNLFFWGDYVHATSTFTLYFSTSNTKPASPNFTLTGFSFDAGSYYIGFGGATGGSTENHILRSMKLTFT
jgi:hypothetical protein